MTNEEREKAIDVLERKHLCMNTSCLSVKQLCSECPRDTTNDEVDSAIITALESLKQESCEDAISRKAVLELINNYGIRMSGNKAYEDVCNGLVRAIKIALCDAIKNVSSVTPTRGHGKWLGTESEEMEIVGYYCSNCDLPLETEEKTDFCPHCGARMEN